MSQDSHKPLGMMADWPNDDLCLEETTLKHLQDTFPRAAPIFDASDLHSLFMQHEGPANRAKKLARRWGKIAIGFGFAGLVLATLFSITSHIFPSRKDTLLPILAVLVCVTTVLSAIIGYRTALKGKTKQVWMENRLLYFNNP